MIRVWWHLSEYISHRRAGIAYRDCLERVGHVVVDDPAQADVAVLHEDPIYWPGLIDRYPALRAMPKIGFAVWELETLPEVYRPGLGLVDEVWTASTFSASALAQGHPRVRVLPHVVTVTEPDRAALDWVTRRLGLGEGARYFFSVMDTANPRKNVAALLRVFSRIRVPLGADIRLVVKQYRAELPLGTMPQVVSIGETLSESRLAALYRLALGYVSPHRGEAWGLGLSEAMSHGCTVLATGWSGNMDFMTAGNSVPLRFSMEPVGDRMVRMLPHYRSEMRWAAVDERHLEREMLRLGRRGPSPDIIRQARAVADRFSPTRVAEIADGLLRAFFFYSKNIR